MNDEKLIYLVEANKELYDKGNPYYKFHGRKKNIWEQIGLELHTSGDECMRRWVTLRDRYGREIRKSVAPSGSGADYHRPWYLLENMKFLKPHVNPRPIRCSQNVCPDVTLPTTQIVDCVPSSSAPIHVPLSIPSPSTNVSLGSPSPRIMGTVPSPSPPIMVTMPSPSPPACVSVGSPSPSTLSPLPLSPARPQSQRLSEKKRCRCGDVDKSMLEAIDIFKKKGTGRGE